MNLQVARTAASSCELSCLEPTKTLNFPHPLSSSYIFTYRSFLGRLGQVSSHCPRPRHHVMILMDETMAPVQAGTESWPSADGVSVPGLLGRFFLVALCILDLLRTLGLAPNLNHSRTQCPGFCPGLPKLAVWSSSSTLQVGSDNFMWTPASGSDKNSRGHGPAELGGESLSPVRVEDLITSGQGSSA